MTMPCTVYYREMTPTDFSRTIRECVAALTTGTPGPLAGIEDGRISAGNLLAESHRSVRCGERILSWTKVQTKGPEPS